MGNHDRDQVVHSAFLHAAVANMDVTYSACIAADLNTFRRTNNTNQNINNSLGHWPTACQIFYMLVSLLSCLLILAGLGAWDPAGAGVAAHSLDVAAPGNVRRDPKDAPKTRPRRPKPMWKRPNLFGSIFHRFLRLTCLQLGSPNPPKSFKNRCQDAFHLGLHLWIDFWSIFAPNFYPRKTTKR